MVEVFGEPEMRFDKSAFKRAELLGYDEDDLRQVILGDMFIEERDQEVRSLPDARAYMAHGWTRNGHYLEVGFYSPDHGGGYYVVHAMPSRKSPGR